MTSKTTKTILFASLLVAMILPFSSMNLATAETQNDTSNHFEKFLKLADKQQTIHEKLKIAEHSDNTKLVNQLQNRIDVIQESMDALQQEYIESIALTEEEKQELDAQGLRVFNELSDPESSLYVGVAPNSYFVSQISKSTHLIFEGPELSTMSTSSAALMELQSNNDKGEFDGSSYSVGNIEKTSHFITCSDRHADCNYLMGGLAVAEGSEVSTMAFWAKHDNGDIGFVMTAHGANALGKTIDQFPTRDVGVVDVITSEAWGECDCAFVDATETVVKRVFTSSGNTDTISSYATSLPSIGTWLQVSGQDSDMEYGTYAGWHTTYKMMINVSLDGGDSGAPVTTLGSSVTAHGMIHAKDSNYGYATPYYEIKSELDLQ